MHIQFLILYAFSREICDLTSFRRPFFFYRVSVGVDSKKLNQFHKDPFINLDPPVPGTEPSINNKVMVASGPNWTLLLSVQHRDEFKTALKVIVSDIKLCFVIIIILFLLYFFGSTYV